MKKEFQHTARVLRLRPIHELSKGLHDSSQFREKGLSRVQGFQAEATKRPPKSPKP